MTRPDKHAARFGDRYRPPIDWRRFRDGLQKAQPAIHRMTEAIRLYQSRWAENAGDPIADGTGVPWDGETSDPVSVMRIAAGGPTRVWVAPVGTAAPTVAELEAGTPIRGISHASFGTHSRGDVVDVSSFNPPFDTIEHSLPYGNVYYRTDRPVPVPVHQPARSPAEFVQYADDILEAVGYDPMYPEPHQHTDEPWPFKEF